MAKEDNFSPEEREAMRERTREFRAARAKAKKDPLGDLMSKIEEMSPSDKKIALRIHELVTKTAPHLEPKTWYGMPAYAKDGKVVCFFQASGKFKVRYSTFGFQEDALLDDGTFWPTTWALTALTPQVEKQIVQLVKKAAG